MLNQPNRLRHVISICVCATLLLSACTSPSFPLEITEITVSPDPIIGQVATLHVEVMSTEDEPDTTIEIRLPDGVQAVKGDLVWQGELVANQVQTHEISICVLAEGDWRIAVDARSKLSEQSSYTDSATVHLISTVASAQVISGDEYRYVQPTGGVPPRTPPPQISPECSGQAG